LQSAGTFSDGEQQILAIGKALMSNPKLIMLDEPSLGLAPLVVESIMDSILRIKERGTAILLVEQNVAESLRVAERGYVLEGGTITISGTSENLINNEKVKRLQTFMVHLPFYMDAVALKILFLLINLRYFPEKGLLFRFPSKPIDFL